MTMIQKLSITLTKTKPLSSSENDNSDNDSKEQTGVMEKVEVSEPSFYKVLLVNDDFTPMEFVVHVLEKFYNKTAQEAESIMINVHKKGQGLAGIFPFEIAETKVFITNNYAKQNKYPLKCAMEKE